MENVIQAIPLKGFNTASIVGTAWYPLSTGLDQACFHVRIINSSNIDLWISYDAYTPIDCVQSNDTFSLGGSFCDKQLWWEKGLSFYVRNSATAGGAGTGLVYVAGYYR